MDYQGGGFLRSQPALSASAELALLELVRSNGWYYAYNQIIALIGGAPIPQNRTEFLKYRTKGRRPYDRLLRWETYAEDEFHQPCVIFTIDTNAGMFTIVATSARVSMTRKRSNRG